jgi:hypothetical protein
MKKAAIGLIVIFFAGCCKSNNQGDSATDPSKTAIGTTKVATERVTLNGISAQTANNMVSEFKKNCMSSHTKTAIWFSKIWVEKIDNILNREGADGFRIYYAKNADKKNTVVIVSTKDDGPDFSKTCDTHRDHLDYFGHTSPFLDTLNAGAHAVEEYDGSDPGATLYTTPDCTGSCLLGATNNISCENATIAVKKFGKQSINTRSEWFPRILMDGLKKELDGEPKKFLADGIRIYFAFHPLDIPGAPSTNPKHPGRHAFIIVATHTAVINGIKRNRVDYYKCYANFDKDFFSGDNGEQCQYNCTGATLPQ